MLGYTSVDFPIMLVLEPVKNKESKLKYKYAEYSKSQHTER